MQTRREMLGVLAGGAALLAAKAPKSAYRPLLCQSVYVWTQQFTAQKKPLAEGLEEMCAASARAGFKRLELLAAMVKPDVLPKTGELLKKHRLEPSIVYAGGPMHEPAAAEKTFAEILEAAGPARSLGARIIDTNPAPKPKKARKTDEELDTQARCLNRIAGALRKRGMRLIVHHHDPEMAENAREWRHILKNTDAKIVGICMDIDWVIRGGQQPLELLREAGARLAELHLRNSRAGVWTESLDEGDYDYPSIAAYLREIGYRGYLGVELAYEKGTAPTRPLEEDLRLSRVFAERVFGL
jgi:inosose dehydratase